MPATLDAVFRPILRSAAFGRLSEAARGESGPLNLTGLTESSKALFLLLLRRELARPVLLVTSDDRAMEEWRRDLTAYSHVLDPAGALGRICRFPALDADPYLGLPPHFQTSCDRVTTLLRIAQGEASFVIAPARALIQPLPPPAELAQLVVRLAAGATVDLEGLLRRLVDLGYRRTDIVASAGEFARRGGILDVFPPGEENPVRAEFTGDEIESLRSFEPDSQRSIEAVPEVTIAPTAEVPMTAARRAHLAEAARARATARFAGTGEGPAAELATARWQALLTGGEFSGIEGCAGLALAESSDVFTHIGMTVRLQGERAAPAAGGGPAAGPLLLAVDEPDNTEAELDSVYAELASSREATSGPLPRPEELFIDPRRIRAALARGALRLSELRVGERVQDLHLVCQPARNYAGRVAEWRRDLGRDRLDGRQTVLLLNTLGTLERAAELLRDEGVPYTVVGPEAGDVHLPERGSGPAGVQAGPAALAGDTAPASTAPQTAAPPITLMQGHLNHGFVLPDLGIALHAERELFGEEPRPQPKRAKRRGAAFISDFRDLKIGDAVVHIDHGIGRFEGLHRMGGAANREFMLLTYEAGGRLFIPVDRLDLVQKYSAGGPGTSEAPVKLDKLGGTGWMTRRARVRKAVAEMTAELLELYAKRRAMTGRAFGPDTPWQREFDDAFPWTATPDQERSIAEVKTDLETPRPMERLLCGDVGFGKTEVAMRAAFKAIQEGLQVAVLCPTTVLALQHLGTFRARFSAFPVTTEMVSRFRSPTEIREVLKRTAAGQVDILIGTHRLLSKDVRFARLGLLVVDEEQRFGVAHKERLKVLSQGIHTLTLTATPIPRTLQMSLAGVRDMSVIETPPQNRLAIQTNLVPFKPGLIAAAIRNELRRGGQVFYVHNRVETLPAQAARLKELVPEAKVLVGHGQMERHELEDVMLKFMAGEGDILAATTIIENGLDLPRVNTLVVNRADRFGLAQLYQLRGRIGRSDVRAYAYFIIPGREALSPPARRRLIALQEFSDLGSGFRLAAMDLEIRGAGELLGARQHGHIEALGFDLYVQMLERAVREMQGEEIPDVAPTAINLGVDIRLPEMFVPEPSLRLAFYKRVSSAEDDHDLDEIRAEMADRYGPLPRTAENLFALAALRIGAMRLGMKSLDWSGSGIAVQFHEPPRVDPARLLAWVARRAPQVALTPSGVLRVNLPAHEDRVAAARAAIDELHTEVAAV